MIQLTDWCLAVHMLVLVLVLVPFSDILATKRRAIERRRRNQLHYI